MKINRIDERKFWIKRAWKNLGNVWWGLKSFVENMWRVATLHNPPWVKAKK